MDVVVVGVVVMVVAVIVVLLVLVIVTIGGGAGWMVTMGVTLILLGGEEMEGDSAVEVIDNVVSDGDREVDDEEERDEL